MISLTSKVDFYENSFDLLKSIANPNPLQIIRRLYNVCSLFLEMKLPKINRISASGQTEKRRA
ncbi:hypothetical protein V7654_03810 [Bacillus sp. JJ1609]|uniref:hypothetical protein n=1 Tax=Bacillus sp. JJ1609 TaxID=3122977 RepID=UPI002FFEECD3